MPIEATDIRVAITKIVKDMRSQLTWTASKNGSRPPAGRSATPPTPHSYSSQLISQNHWHGKRTQPHRCFTAAAVLPVRRVSDLYARHTLWESSPSRVAQMPSVLA